LTRSLLQSAHAICCTESLKRHTSCRQMKEPEEVS